MTWGSPTNRLRTASLACALLTGCQLFTADEPNTDLALLKAANAAPQAVTVDLYWAVLPPADGEAGQRLWTHAQESRLPPELRRRLAQNGLRAGVFSGALPPEVHALINPQGATPENTTGHSAPLSQTGVWRRTRQLRPGDPLELKASEPKTSAPLLVASNGELTGRTYHNAQAFYRLEAHRLSSGETELALTPEVRHGAPKARWTPDETGAVGFATSVRDAEVFADLAIRAPLSSGEALLVTSLPNSAARLGGYFHNAEQSAGGGRKAILIRVVQAPRGESLAVIDGLATADLP